jgi:GTP-binding protein
MSRILAIVGRPNVGKSTLFNRLIGTRKAIVDGVSGVTRDRHYGVSEWNGIKFSVIDTGGYIRNSDDIFEEEIRKQVEIAIDEADAIAFVVDVESGLTDLDEEVARILRKQKKDVFLLVNKVDNNARQFDANEFYRLGMENMYMLSSINGSGTGEFLDELILKFKSLGEEEFEFEIPRYAVVGRPNVGKSSFVNALLGENRNIVTAISGTTRDSLHTRYNKFGHDFYLIDTAGLRKRAKIDEDIEFYSSMRSVRAIEDADVCILMLDAERGIEAQDLSIFNLIIKNKKGVVILVNKWDLMEKETNSVKEYTKIIQNRIAPFNDIPILFISALTKQRLHKALDAANEVYENMKRKVPTAKLNEYMQKIIAENQPPTHRGAQIKIKYITQLPTQTPQFAFYCNYPDHVKDPYKRFLENKLRSEYNFKGVPISVYMRKK